MPASRGARDWDRGGADSSSPGFAPMALKPLR